jgi:hypothetical protein
VLVEGSLVWPLHILSPVHWVGVEPMTLRDETSGRTTTPVDPPTVDTLVPVKVDKVDRGKLHHKSVPGVICEVTEHGNYKIACKGGVLKDCLMAQRCHVEELKKPEHYDLQDALENWIWLLPVL